ncbi:MAG: c-type cytochrome [Verrucomicrobiota bacterium]
MKRFLTFVVVALWCVAMAGAQNAPLRPGLVATASDGARKVTFVAPAANFSLAADQSAHPQLKPVFSIEWNGVLNLVRGGTYTITGDARVFIDGQEAQGKPVQLEAGERALRVQYERKGNAPARLQLQWQSDFFKPEPIPASVLGHRNAPAEAAKTAAIERGRHLVEELNCIACHKAGGSLLQGRQGPDLSRVGERANANWLFHWLENPRHFRAAAVMPVVLASANDRADAAAYLAGLKGNGPVAAPAPNAGRAARGKELFNTVGCQACHGEGGVSLAGMGSKTTAAALAKYLENPLAVDPSGRMPHLALSGEEALAIAEHLVTARNGGFEKPAPPGNPARGRQVVASSGCLNCHTLKDAGDLKNTFTAAALNELQPARGCLAELSSGRAPRYELSANERGAIAAFLASPDVSPAPVQDFHRLAARFNCVACHELNGPAKLSFEVNQAPPPLPDAGNKLRAAWLDQVLNHHKRIRPWMALRMPHFGPDNVAPLVQLFAQQAGAEPGQGATIAAASPEEIQAAGKIIGQGEGGLSCINCHDFRGEKSGGEMRGPDMTEMYARIRVDWLKRWLREPSRIQPGTAMPAFFSDLPEAQAERMIQQIVVALSAGSNMPIPQGLSEAAQEYLLLVKDEPITFRTFIQDSSPRSIAVGLPGAQNFCFDAEFCRLRYAWTGDFLDVKPVWANRGGAQARILGVKFYTAPDSHSLRIGDPGKEPAVRFKGYQLINKIPEFMYELDGVLVRELIAKAPTGRGLARKFTLSAPGKDVWYVAGAARDVTLTSTAGKFVDGKLKIPGAQNVQFEVTILAK